jgi:hypothetical protein
MLDHTAFMLDKGVELSEHGRAQLDRLCIAAAGFNADLAQACAANGSAPTPTDQP